MKTWLALLLLATLAPAVLAESTTPASADTVIATWPVSDSKALTTDGITSSADPTELAAVANNYLAQAAMPGQSRLYGLAHAALQPSIISGSNDPGIWLTWAQVRQHQHAFDEALAALEKVLAQQPGNINALLLKARIYLIQDNAAAARSVCLKLVGNADLLTAAACALEAASFQGKLSESYQQLSMLVERNGLPPDERGPWLAQILADMALRLENPAAAQQWLSQQPIDRASVNWLAQWADVQLALGQHKNVLQSLQPIVDSTTDVDDSLLLRLALAEAETGGTLWQDRLKPRMQLREQRADTQHASELATYYLEINPSPQKALHWAEINWQSAREHSDKMLLERAREQVRKLNEASAP